MSELEIFLWLTQASMQISRNKGATKKASIFSKKAVLSPKMVAPQKQITSHNSVHWYQCISLWKMLGGKYYVHDKRKFCAKKTFSAKKDVPNKMFFCVNPSPKYVQHISRNNGATIKASQKTAHDNFF